MAQLTSEQTMPGSRPAIALLPMLLVGLSGCSPTPSDDPSNPARTATGGAPAALPDTGPQSLPEPVAEPADGPAPHALPTPVARPAPGDAPPKNPPSSQPASPRLIAFGTEPFWAVDVLDGALVWKTPENPQGTRLTVKREPTLHGERWTGGNGMHEVALDLIPGECSDGMSDRRHAYTAHWTVDGRTLQGCARSPSARGE